MFDAVGLVYIQQANSVQITPFNELYSIPKRQ